MVMSECDIQTSQGDADAHAYRAIDGITSVLPNATLRLYQDLNMGIVCWQTSENASVIQSMAEHDLP